MSAWRRGTVGAWIVGIGLIALIWVGENLRAQAAGSFMAPIRGTQLGDYHLAEVTKLELPWLLPSPGDGHNTCDAGNILSARWSADGRMIAAEVATANADAVTICVYNLANFGFASGKLHQVSVSRVSATGKIYKAPAAGPKVNELNRTGKSGHRFSEAEVSWRPGALRNEAAIPPIVFTQSQDNRPSSIWGTQAYCSTDDCKRLQLDGSGVAASSDIKALMPSVGPLDTAFKTSVGLVFVSTGHPVTRTALACGKTSLAYTPDGKTITMLVDPCAGFSAGSAEGRKAAALLYPTWNPKESARQAMQLAFVYSLQGERSEICVQNNPLEQSPPARQCGVSLDAKKTSDIFLPAWSNNGRFLAWFESKALPPKDMNRHLGGSRTNIGITDLTSTQPKARTVIDNALPNTFQGPSILATGEWSYLFGISNQEGKGGLNGAITVVNLEKESSVANLTVKLNNIKVVSAVISPEGEIRLALVAQSYRDQKGADAEYDKLYLMRLECAASGCKAANP